MKKLIYFFLLLLAVSCSQDADHVYSCNPQINKSVAENLLEIRKISRKDWSALNEIYKKAVFRAMTTKQKVQLWKDKFEELKKLKWNKQEWQHIQKALLFLNQHSDWYSQELSDSQLDELDIFAYKWCQYGTEELGWTDNLCKAILCSPNRVLNKKGDLAMVHTFKKANTLNGKFRIVYYNDIDTIDGGIDPREGGNADIDTMEINKIPECECSVNNWNLCGLTGQACEYRKCSATTIGCGPFGLSTCSGMCV